MEVNKIIQGDALEVLKTFPDESVSLHPHLIGILEITMWKDNWA